VGYGAFGIRLRARDMANFGQLFLDEGCWNGQQLVPERWVRDATTRIELARYGRLWWDVDVGLHPAFAAMGSDGQLVLVVPKLRLVVADAAQRQVRAFYRHLDCSGRDGDASPHRVTVPERHR
jgi:CubicO group peptidase (beta-lactamase class C family)